MSDAPLTARELRDALEMHARMTRRGSSYEDVAREIGAVVMIAALVWALIFGAPGVPAVHQFLADVSDEMSEHRVWTTLAVVTAIIAGCLYLVSEAVAPYAPSAWMLGAPVRALLRLLRTATLLAGIACAGAAALVPGTAIAHLLGLAG
jgi:hypothetical protein